MRMLRILLRMLLQHMLWVEQEGVMVVEEEVWLGGKVWWKDNAVSCREGSVV